MSPFDSPALAAGLSAIAAATFGIFAYVEGRVDTSDYLNLFYLPGAGELAIFCVALSGGCIGFLWFNAHPAEVFMGDTGSLSVGGALGVRRPLVDLVAGGTMICGTSAVNAIAPVSGAHRHEQGIAIGTVFLFSVFALLVFRPVAFALGMDVQLAGLWSGLAVNDLSSAIAVGRQMGPDGATAAAAARPR